MNHMINVCLEIAVDEFAALVDNGARSRDLLEQGRDTEISLALGVRRYKNWTLRDANLINKSYPDLTIICAAKPNESTESVIKRVEIKLRALGEQWRQVYTHWDAQHRSSKARRSAPVLPTLFAFVVKYSIVQLMSLDVNQLNAPPRVLEMLNHQLEGRDVWQAFAISIVCIFARNFLLEIESKGMFEALHQSIEDHDE